MAGLQEYQQCQVDRAGVDVGTHGNLLGLKADLTQQDVPIGPGNTLGQFTSAIATFDGYAQGVVTWGTPSIASDGTVEVLGTLTQWRPSGSVVQNVIYDIFFSDTGGTKLYYAGRLDGAPISMGSTLNQITVTVRYRPATQSLVVNVD